EAGGRHREPVGLASGEAGVSLRGGPIWGPVSRRGGARPRSQPRSPGRSTSMGPRLSTGGAVAHLAPRLAVVPTSMGPRLSTGGSEEAAGIRAPHHKTSMGPRLSRGGSLDAACYWHRPCCRFNGAPSLDGGEPATLTLRLNVASGASMGPRLSTGGSQ